jgi:Tfp pilus assembly protein PilO
MESNKPEKKTAISLVYLNRNYKTIILLIIIIIMIGGYYFFLTDKIGQINEQKSGLAEKEAELETLGVYADKLGNLEKIVNDFQRKNSEMVAKLDVILPNSAQLPELLAQLEGLVGYSNFKIKGLNAVKATEERTSAKTKSKAAKQEEKTTIIGTLPQNIKTLKVSLTVAGGDYPEFKKFLNNIEKHVRIFDVTSFSFNASKDGVSNYSINLQTYYFES